MSRICHHQLIVVPNKNSTCFLEQYENTHFEMFTTQIDYKEVNNEVNIQRSDKYLIALSRSTGGYMQCNEALLDIVLSATSDQNDFTMFMCPTERGHMHVYSRTCTDTRTCTHSRTCTHAHTHKGRALHTALVYWVNATPMGNPGSATGATQWRI